MAQTVRNLNVCRKVFLKHYVNWDTVFGSIQDMPLHYNWLGDNSVEILNEHLSLLLIRYVPTKVIRAWLKACFCTQMQHAFGLKQVSIFGGHVIALGLIRKSLSAVK